MDFNINLSIAIDSKDRGDIDKLCSMLQALVSSDKSKQSINVSSVKLNTESKVETKQNDVVGSESAKNTETDVKPEKVAVKKYEPVHISRLIKRLSKKNKEDLLAAAELLDERYDGKNISYLSFVSKVIKTAKLPLCAIDTVKKSIGDKFDFHWYHRNKHQNTPELCRDAAILLYAGVSNGIVKILTEQTMDGANLQYIYSLAKKGFSEEDVFNVNVKYQNELKVYGITELAPNKNWLVNIEDNNRSTKKMRRFKYSPDKVNELVVMYRRAVRNGLKGRQAVLDAAKHAEIKACEGTLMQMLFNHKDVPGYEQIDQPIQVRDHMDITNAETLSKVRTTKFLYNSRGMSCVQISNETGMTLVAVKNICSGITYSQVIVDAESERVLEERYPICK